jgi:hypothetical protein
MSRNTVHGSRKPALILAGVTVPPLLTLPVAVVLHLLGHEALAASIATPGVAVLSVLLVGASLWQVLGWRSDWMRSGGEGTLYPRKGHWFRAPRSELALQSYLDRRRY